MVLGIALVVLIIFLFLIFVYRSKRSNSHENCQQLLRICNGEQALVQRLLEYEKRQNLQLSDEEACRMAVMSYKRDNQ
jgi:hypothetical protein